MRYKFMRSPLAVPCCLNLCSSQSDPQDEMDVIFPLFSFKSRLWKMVPQQRINSEAVPVEEFSFKNHCCKLVPKRSIKEE